jgi:hypothetical protein
VIVFDLRCGKGHVFEAWFGSSAAYDTQRAEAAIACPLCGDTAVAKAAMAPAVPAKGNRSSKPPTPAAVKAAMRQLAQLQAKALEGSQWVGATFATRARAMHEGEEAAAPIHGQASRAEVEALAEDGVPIAPLPLPITPPDTAH